MTTQPQQAMNKTQGHWLLAKMGKKVLRPGGKEMTQAMITTLAINNNDDVVEFAPGLGITAKLSLSYQPKSYTGVELNEEAASIARKNLHDSDEVDKSLHQKCSIIIGNASKTSLRSASYSKVYGEAMLSMQSDLNKSEIFAEAYRILKPDGLYAIHELGLQPNDISEQLKQEIQLELSKVIKVKARPLTLDEWSTLGQKQGFKVRHTQVSAMALLEPKRLLDDEGIFGVIKIGFNVLTHPKERKRIIAMRKVFQKYRTHLNAVSVVFQK